MSLPLSETAASSPEADLRPSVPAAAPQRRPARPDHATVVARLGGASSAELRAERRGGIGDPYAHDDHEGGSFAHFSGLRRRSQ